ncbi:LysR family transcriptional regulator [Terasakiispira papahanaumokuakeensis]|uniref:LysR family transcriptional regulator n=1 Tax=Terasakiispira papahanaumokuakeensis TaxID=197479 RepID=A0A1E2V712_9GAMM|nr:LysR family transcriptional regulator [Terasakiispira papahanaumokuakeensis]ODC02764.1 LysR family transcriptional regulator [Terasakiispira papahanaumokuakeensis]
MAAYPNLDLNLIKLFASLYETGSVTQTAEALNLSQSACSHALQRLRERLGDELFVRIDQRMHPTIHARHLAERVLPGLQLLTQGLASAQPFDPTQPQLFRIAATDYTGWCLRPLMRDLNRTYPAIQIEFLHLESRIPETALERGDIDLVCGFDHGLKVPESLVSHLWRKDHYVSVRCRQHPIPTQGLSLSEFLRYPHILVTPWNEPRGIVDITLAKHKKKRHIGLKTTSVLAAPDFLPGTDYLLALPAYYAQRLTLPVHIEPLPLAVPDYQLTLYWHKTRQHDPKIEWLIQTFKALAHIDEGESK